jgi:hypothetical protein
MSFTVVCLSRPFFSSAPVEFKALFFPNPTLKQAMEDQL